MRLLRDFPEDNLSFLGESSEFRENQLPLQLYRNDLSREQSDSSSGIVLSSQGVAVHIFFTEA